MSTQNRRSHHPTTTQAATQAATQASRIQRDEEEDDDDTDHRSELLDKKANDCVQYILLCCLANNKAVVKRVDLNKNVLTDHSRSFRKVIRIVKSRIKDVFGLELVDLDAELNKCERFGIKTRFEFDPELNFAQNIHLRTMTQFTDHSESHADDPELHERAKYSVLMIALSLIFMNENEISAEIFWESLKKLDINKDDKCNVYLGDVNKYFTFDLVRDGYLEYELVKGSEPAQYKFKWGYRAFLEISKKQVLDFVCEVYGGQEACKPEDWVAQYADAYKSNKEKKPKVDKENEEMEEED